MNNVFRKLAAFVAPKSPEAREQQTNKARAAALASLVEKALKKEENIKWQQFVVAETSDVDCCCGHCGTPLQGSFATFDAAVEYIINHYDHADLLDDTYDDLVIYDRSTKECTVAVDALAMAGYDARKLMATRCAEYRSVANELNIPLDGLVLRNSLTRRKDAFAPGADGVVRWYACGPTVYDAAHLGHARNYVAADMVRRVLEDYFHLEVRMAMNVTDVDDKIIARADPAEGLRAFAARHERDFWADMDALLVRRPHVVARVSEYIPEIVAFVERLIHKGVAYVAADGSVLFDTAAFAAAGHTYGKLRPAAVAAAAAAATPCADGKRAPPDFALWKACAGPHEPGWDSPWGRGRPGWHVECSAMASAVFGAAPLDIHSGGEDLCFPHHDNELAQSEAFHGCHDWVRFFLHTGHLEVAGLKMSKSLKNFTSVREALRVHSPRQLRLHFAMHAWDRPMTFGAFSQALAREASFASFLAAVDAAERVWWRASGSAREAPPEAALRERVAECSAAVHAALCDSVNTPAVVDALAELVRHANAYMAAGGVHPGALRAAAELVVRRLALLGIDMVAGAGAGAGALEALVAFRDAVRQAALAGPTRPALLALCDRLRDKTLPALGATVADRSGQQ